MKELLIRSKQEIVALRRENEILSAQVSIVNIFAAALGMKPANQGCSVDVAWELQREIDRITKAEK